MGDMIDRQKAIDHIMSRLFETALNQTNEFQADMCEDIALNRIAIWVNELPEEESAWNNHTVACLLADMYGDACACNFNNNDEWLPKYCEVINTCPNPGGVACWEQYLKHRKKAEIKNF